MQILKTVLLSQIELGNLWKWAYQLVNYGMFLAKFREENGNDKQVQPEPIIS